MGRNLKQIVVDLPAARRNKIDAQYRRMKDEVESLRELREATGKAQAEIAAVLDIKQPSVSKIEKQADMYLSTLRSYIRAIGGELDLVVRLPKRNPVRLRHIGDLHEAKPPVKSVRRRRATAD